MKTKINIMCDEETVNQRGMNAHTHIFFYYIIVVIIKYMKT